MSKSSSRYHCKAEGFEKCWLEVKDSWTMKEVRDLVAANDDETYFKIFADKVTAMYLEDSCGEVFTDPKEFGNDQLEQFDVTVAGFLGNTLPLHVERRRQLGKWSATLLSDGSDEKS